MTGQVLKIAVVLGIVGRNFNGDNVTAAGLGVDKGTIAFGIAHYAEPIVAFGKILGALHIDAHRRFLRAFYETQIAFVIVFAEKVFADT